MKRNMVLGPLLVVVMAGSLYCDTATAFTGRGGGARGTGKCLEEGTNHVGGRFPRQLPEGLGLTEEQKTRIRKILTAERAANKPLLRKLRDARNAVQDAGETVPFDEAAVRAAVTREHELRAELVVSHARTRSRIQALLTAEQREAADELLPPPPHRPEAEPLGQEGF